MTDRLNTLGYTAEWQRLFRERAGRGFEPARILAQHRGWWTCATESDTFDAKPNGALWRTPPETHPAVGDWVVVKRQGARIHHVLPRHTAFVRQAAGKRTKVQVICTNVDRVLVVTAAEHDFNLRRLERYLTAIRQSGAEPVVVVSKCDLVDDPGACIAQVRALDSELAVVGTTVKTSEGLADLEPFLSPGETIALVGSSGVGKSTLVNALYGQSIQSTKEVRDQDGRGRHTTTHRELFVMPSGVLLIDTPGMREFTVWAELSDLDVSAFDDVTALAEGCRFRNCQHRTEPGCAVRRALEGGELSEERLASFHKLQEELESQAELQRGALLLQSKQADRRR